MRIGLFGGTFNPIHWGHLRSAEEIRARFDLHTVFFIPAKHPPHKKKEGLISATHRLNIVRLATRSNPHFKVSRVDVDRPGTSYSIHTIRHFRERYGPRLVPFFILGMDSFEEIRTWKDYRRLFSLCHFIVMTRPGYRKKNPRLILPDDIAKGLIYKKREKRFVLASNFSIYFQEITGLDISSTAIRKKVKEKESIKYLVPPEVEAYLLKHRLYQDEH